MAQPGWRSYLGRILGWLGWTPGAAATSYYGPTVIRETTARAEFVDETDIAVFRDHTSRAVFEVSVYG